MANPQKENGYTMLANEILDRIMQTAFNGTQFRIVIAVWRNTYGYRRKEHAMSIDYIAQATKVHPTQVKREIKNLIDQNVIVVVKEADNNRARTISFNKDYDTWFGGANPLPQEENRGSELAPTGGTDLLPRGGADSLPNKESKESIKENIYVEIISHLNQKTGKRYSAKVKNTRELINGRISEGRTLEDFKLVIDTKCSHWLNDLKMVEYLRPDTLFRPSNFDKYLNQQPYVVMSRDPAIESRDKEAAFQQWMQEGRDPDEFDWS